MVLAKRYGRQGPPQALLSNPDQTLPDQTGKRKSHGTTSVQTGPTPAAFQVEDSRPDQPEPGADRKSQPGNEPFPVLLPGQPPHRQVKTLPQKPEQAGQSDGADDPVLLPSISTLGQIRHNSQRPPSPKHPPRLRIDGESAPSKGSSSTGDRSAPGNGRVRHRHPGHDPSPEKIAVSFCLREFGVSRLMQRLPASGKAASCPHLM